MVRPGRGPDDRRAPAPAVLDRDQETARIAAALAAARSGTGSVLLVAGPAGIGKTTLLDLAVREAGAGPGPALRVLSARGSPLEQDLAHGVARQLLEPTIRTATGRVRTALLAGAAALATAVVLPETEDPDARPGDRRGPVVHGLYWLTANLTQRGPLLLTIDDLQWSDQASLRYLVYLAGRMDGLPVVVLATLRTGDADQVTGPLGELTAGPSVEVLRPAPLSVGAVERLVAASLPGRSSTAMAAACRDATGGVPFLLAALLDSLGRGGQESKLGPDDVGTVTSATVGHATLLRLSRLGPAAVPVARAVAVAGRHATSARIAGLTGLDEATVLRAVDQLIAADVLLGDLPVRFTHPIVAGSVYRDMPAGERALAHAAVAAALADAGQGAEDVAVHLLSAAPGIVEGAADALRDAAVGALAAGAPESAVTFLRRCLDEPGAAADRARVLHRLARAEAMVGDEQAIERFEHARRAAGDAEPALAATISLDLAEALMSAGRWQAAIGEVDRTLATLRGTTDPDPPAGSAVGVESAELAETVGRLEVFRAGMMANDQRLVDAFERDRPRLTALAARPGTAGALMAALLASCAVCRGEPTDQVLELVDRGLVDTGLLLGADADAWGPQVVATLAFVSDLDRAQLAADEMRSAARSRGAVYGFVRGAALRVLVAGLRGDLRAAEADLRSAFELSLTHRLMFSVPPLLRWAVDALLERPGLADLAAAVEDIDLDPVLAESFSGAWLLETRGRLRLRRGDSVGAATDLRRVGATMSSLHVSNPAVTGWRSALAEALAGTDPERAGQLAQDELADAERAGTARSVGVSLRACALLVDGPEREALLRRSAATLAAAGAPLELARTEVELGSTLRRTNRRAAALDVLRSALDDAHRCGADRLAARAEDELRGIGARPRRRAVSGPDSLTPGEARVAAAAAAGMTNREIAQALFVTAKTVENQLGRSYAKLGIRGREDLPGALTPEPAEN